MRDLKYGVISAGRDLAYNTRKFVVGGLVLTGMGLVAACGNMGIQKGSELPPEPITIEKKVYIIDPTYDGAYETEVEEKAQYWMRKSIGILRRQMAQGGQLELTVDDIIRFYELANFNGDEILEAVESKTFYTNLRKQERTRLIGSGAPAPEAILQPSEGTLHEKPPPGLKLDLGE